ncbi:MAG TPA: hypothetical protein VGY98_05045 [Verrucomicrobiae bacterium]|nr:hypothetical protein [Verrucomicrobiae bacterium]
MKLGKLLAAGKSIMNGRAEISYRSSKQIYLPKFGSAKNPFKSEGSGPVDVSTPASAPVTAAAEACPPMSAPSRVVPPNEPRVERESLPVAAASSRIPEQVQPARQPVARSRQTGSASSAAPQSGPPTVQRFNALVSVFRAALPARAAGRSESAAKGLKGTPTQTELSLDAVKVVHNDLSDVDVEVVPIKSRATTPELPAPKKSWEFVGERLFGVEAT